jgi:aldose 1-epimerase
MIQIETPGTTAHLDADAGGRLTRLSWRRSSGHIVDIVVPMTGGLRLPRWPKAGAYPLIPYANRIAQGRLSFTGRSYEVAPHPDAYPHSLHGHSHLERWICSATGDAFADLSLACDRSKFWPWSFEARQRFSIEKDRLAVTVSLRNTDRVPMPAGLGWHPYFATAGSTTLVFDAEEWWPHASDYLPLGHPQPLDRDLRSPLVAEEGLTAYLGGWSGKVQVIREDGVQITLLADKIFDHLVVHRPTKAAYLCIEPVTHVANGFNLAAAGVHGAGLHVLEAGDELTGTICMELSEQAASTMLDSGQIG